MKSSGNGQKCYNIKVTGKVQDIGFRALIENAGRLFDLSGLVFNAKDGSVRIVCCGEESVIGEFSQEVTIRGEQRGVTIQDLKKQELPIKIDLPYPFSKVFADDDIDLGRKLDKGNDFLGELTRSSSEILKNTSVLPDIKDGIENLNIKLDSSLTEQRGFNQEMREHNKHLEKILEKLAEK